MDLFSCGCIKALNSHVQALIGACPFVQLAATTLGLALLCCVSLALVRRGFKILFTRKFQLDKFGEWAVVTGATDGIGKAMAIQMAKKGMKIFLISRNEERLRQTEQDLQAAVPALRGVKSFAVDFSEGSTESLFQKLDAALKNLDVGILVNNVGVSYPHAMFYDELDLETLDQLINVNVRSTLVTTRVLYPGMVSRRRGAIICVGSGASEIASDPLYCAYSATKGAAEAFCRSLQPECASKNILVQCHVPLLVTTKLSKMRKTNLMTPSTEKYAKAAVAAIENGSLRGPTTISPYCVHRCIIWLSNAVPRRIWEAAYLPRCLSIRKRAVCMSRSGAELRSGDMSLRFPFFVCKKTLYGTGLGSGVLSPFLVVCIFVSAEANCACAVSSGFLSGVHLSSLAHGMHGFARRSPQTRSISTSDKFKSSSEF